MKKLCNVLCLFTALFLCLSMVSCGKPSGATPLSSRVLEELCSEPYTGRLAGTPGNAKAAQYLAGVMQELGIAPFSDGYEMSYPQITADPNKQNTTVTIINADGSKRELRHGKDFYTNAAKKDLTLELPLAWGAAQWKPGTIPVLLPGDIMSEEAKTDLRFGTGVTPALNVGTPESLVPFQIKLSAKLGEELRQNGAVSAAVRTTAVPEQSTPHNVVGILRGAPNSQNAVVLTAHFDHVGRQGDFLFNGVLDNASGTATLLSAAQRLVELVKVAPPNFDIIIAAVNSEETRGAGIFPGSDSLARLLSTRYQSISNINIDCVGTGDPYNLGDTDPQNNPSIALFRDWLSQRSIAFSDVPYTASDHSSFQSSGHPAFTVGGGVSGDAHALIHSNIYKTSDISVQEMETLAQAVAEFVIQRGDTLLDAAVAATAELAKTSEVVTEPLRGMAEVSEAYPALSLPETLGDYSFTEAEIQTEDPALDPSGGEKIRYLFLTYTHLDATRQLEVICIKKREGEPSKPSSKEHILLPMTEPGFTQYTLKSYNGGESFYAVILEKDNFVITISVNQPPDGNLQHHESLLFQAGDAPGLIQSWGLE